MQIPDVLTDLQHWMAPILQRTLRNRDAKGIPLYEKALIEEAHQRIKPSSSLTPEKRLGLYNQQVWYRFFNLLQKDYPALMRIFSPHDFNFLLAEPYLQAHWPTELSLTFLSSKFPTFLSTHYQEEDRRLVLPLAALDEAYHRLNTNLPPALFEMEADLFAFRAALLKHPPEFWIENDFPHIDWGPPRHTLLFYQNDTFHIEPLDPAAFRLLRALLQGASLPNAINALSEQEKASAEPQIFSWFRRWASLGWLL